MLILDSAAHQRRAAGRPRAGYWLRAFAVVLGVVGLFETAPTDAPAQMPSYPNGVVRIVVASSPGSSLDVHARILADRLKDTWNQPVIIENKPGGSMAIGAAYAAKAAPDGYTLFFSIDTPFVVNVVVSSDLPYRVSDFAPISLWSINPFLLLVNSKLPATSLPELLTLLRANPGKYNASSASATTLLAHELLKSLANVEYAVIPYKGGAEAIVSVASGETQLAFYDLGNARAMIESGAVRPLAQTPLQRSAALPDIPTLAESGVPGFEAGTWGALFAPAQTPQHIVDKINADVRKIIAMPEIVEKLRGLGVEPRTSSPEELSTMIAESTAKWSVLVKQRNIKIAR